MSVQDTGSGPAGYKEALHLPVQETDEKESLSEWSAARSPINFSRYIGSAKEDAEAVKTSIRELVEEHKHDRQQLLEINQKLENIMKNVDHLDCVLKNQQKEIEILRQELKPAKAEQSTLEVKLQKQPDHQDEGKIKHQPEIKSENVQQQYARDNFGTQEDFVTILEDDSEASEQMEERRRRRVSVQPQIEPVERERIDSGVSVTSVDGGGDSCSPNMESSSSELPEMFSSLSGSLAVMERPFVEDHDKTPVCTPTASPIPQRKTKNC